jgi:hypothetical protein
MKQGLIALILISVCAACGDVQQTGTETFTLPDTFSALSVETIGGSITVLSDNGSDGGADITVTVEKKARGFSEDHAKLLLDEITVTSRQEAGTHTILVTVPPLVDGGASLTIANVKGKKVLLSTTAGDLYCDEAQGFSARTKSGSVDIKRAAGELDVTADNGDVAVEDFSGSIFSVRTASADVRLKLTGKTIAAGVIQTSNGKISLSFPSSLACTADLRTENGDIDFDAIEPVSVSTSDDFINGIAGLHEVFILNGGGGTISAETSSAGSSGNDIAVDLY